MVNKKGWLRIVEAVIAIFIIFGVLIVIQYKGEKKASLDLSDICSPLLEQIARNISTRAKVVSQDPSAFKEINSTISEKLDKYGAMSELKLCSVEDPCSLSLQTSSLLKGKEIQSFERIISSTPSKFATQRIKVFVWKK
jgi:hypothetical protein